MHQKLRRAWRYVRKNKRAILVWGISGGFVLGGLIFLWAATLQIPDLASLSSRKIEQSVKIYDRTGQVLLSDLNQDVARTIVPLSEISPLARQAIISIEDPEFYTHKGVKPTAILRAIFTNISQGDLSGQGGSTITQQVVKGSLLVNDKTIARKLKEWVLALKLEKILTKDQILELYLNQVPMGGNMYGLEEGAQTFFGKHIMDVSLVEAAYLAAVLPSPTRLSPYRHDEDGRNDRLDARKNLVLDKMFEAGYITAPERDEAKAVKIEFQAKRANSILAPHFVFYVQQYLEDKYGLESVEKDGWKITTTLDSELQLKAEEVVKAGALLNTTKFHATNAALIGLNPQNGQILTMVGSRNYFDTEIPGAYNVATMHPGRQPGSTFKPFAYAEAFLKGYTPDTVVFDTRTQFSTNCAWNDETNGGVCFSPGNYDDLYRGPMTLRNALAQSINIPAVKVLYLAGLADTLRLAKSMGITTLTNPAQYGLTLVLGGGEVTLLDMTSAYGVFATDGVHYEPTAILKIEDAQGNVIEDNSTPAGTQVLPQSVAQEINDVLSDNAAREPLGVNSALAFGSREVAVKTGTTNNYKDAWTVGYTPSFVLGMWAGNNDNSPMEKKVSGLIVGPMWHDVMAYELPRIPVESFSRSESTAVAKPALAGLWTINGSDNRPHEILYWVDRSNPTGPQPSNPESDSQYTRWELPVQAWLTQHNINGGFQIPTTTPSH